ncbi:MAG: hypothetical protein M1814_003334 [Vezdaea aestivalis]|nr:MAG: hypothetical protein M1814_003334 [Vezdaea aestivalis]
MATANYRLIDIDCLDPESSSNFDITSLSPPVAQYTISEIQSLGSQIRQLLRGGDAEGALTEALRNAPYGASDQTKEVHLATVIEILQSIKQSEMSPMLGRLFRSDGGTELLDALMKYIYKGMAHSSHASSTSTKFQSPQGSGFSQVHTRNTGEGGGAAMSVLLSWHEKLVEIAGPGSIIRVMSDRRVV